jgi:hypothetical protein
MKLKWLIHVLIINFFVSGQILAASADDNKPKLVLQITVDQLRGDLPMRFKERPMPTGSRLLKTGPSS